MTLSRTPGGQNFPLWAVLHCPTGTGAANTLISIGGGFRVGAWDLAHPSPMQILIHWGWVVKGLGLGPQYP